jgi:hypothetical protein
MILVPGVIELDGDQMTWKDAGPAARGVEVTRVMLNRFVNLWSTRRSTDILAFARNWGVLRFARGQPNRPCAEAIWEGADPIDAWRYFSRRASAVLSIGAALKIGKLGDTDDWRQLTVPKNGDLKAAMEHHNYGLGVAFGDPTTVETARRMLATEIQRWFTFWKANRLTGVSDFAASWNPKSGRLELKINYNLYLLAAVALQLALVIAEADSLYACSGCGVPYIRDKKRPKSGSANYCDSCTKQGIAQRRAVESYRERKAEVRRLAADGVSIDEIAQRLGLAPKRIGGWLKN